MESKGRKGRPGKEGQDRKELKGSSIMRGWGGM